MDKSKMFGSRIPRAPKRSGLQTSFAASPLSEKQNIMGERNANPVALKGKRAGAPLPQEPATKRANGGGEGDPTHEWLEISESIGLDVEGLLNLRMTGKGKWDHKGRCEQMMPYIKQLRSCVRYLRTCVEGEDQERQRLLDEHDKALQAREKELTSIKDKFASLETEHAELAQESDARKSELASRTTALDGALEESKRQKLEIDSLTMSLTHEQKVVEEKSAEVAKMQSSYHKSQEYAQNLQEFVKKLQEDAKALNESISKMQEEKSKYQDELGAMKGTVTVLESQLSQAKETIQQLMLQKGDLEKQCAAIQDESAQKVEAMGTAMAEQKAAMQTKHDALEKERGDLNTALEALTKEHADIVTSYEACKRELDAKLSACAGLETQLDALSKEMGAKDEAHALTLQAKLEELETLTTTFECEKSKLQQLLDEKKAAMEGVKAELVKTQTEVQEANALLSSTIDEFDACKASLEAKTEECAAKSTELGAAQAELARYHEVTGKSAENMEKLMEQSKALESQNTSQNEVLGHIKAQYELLKQKVQMQEEQCASLQQQNEDKAARLKEREGQLAEAEQQIHDGELLRKKLHNTILELKGNIRVFCRTRPSLDDEMDVSMARPSISYTKRGENAGKGIQIHMDRSDGKELNHYSFDFDRVFEDNTKQEDVFEEINQLVQSALDGYKVCIFAYGQTGSGKTHTMIGNAGDPGMIPRALDQIFASAEKMKEQGWTYSISVSMLEIYNEEYKDLLGNKLPAGKQHTVKHDQQGKTSITYMTDVKVTTEEKVNSLLGKAMAVRSVGATQCNEHSSRSHFVFSMKLDGKNKALGQNISGVLNLVDLAGSERLSKSGATGSRLKETQSINKSLSALGDVICSLNNGDSHIPYRNSKLTWLLQPCLGGQSKALMFVNISPSEASLQESLCSLRFAAKVNACEIGTAKRHVS